MYLVNKPINLICAYFPEASKSQKSCSNLLSRDTHVTGMVLLQQKTPSPSDYCPAIFKKKPILPMHDGALWREALSSVTEVFG